MKKNKEEIQQKIQVEKEFQQVCSFNLSITIEIIEKNCMNNYSFY